MCDSSIGNSSHEQKPIFKANFMIKVKYSIKHWTEQRMSSSDLMKCNAVQGVLQVTWQVQLYIIWCHVSVRHEHDDLGSGKRSIMPLAGR